MNWPSQCHSLAWGRGSSVSAPSVSAARSVTDPGKLAVTSAERGMRLGAGSVGTRPEEHVRILPHVCLWDASW